VASDQISLRQRKKERARHAIQEAALRLFEEKGYDNTTVEEIAASAEVSPSTVYRYFETKDEIVFWDRWDPVIVAALKNRPTGEQPVDSLMALMEEMWPRMAVEEDVMQRRVRLILSEPALRSHMGDHFDAGVDLMIRVLAERTGLDEYDLGLRVVVNSFMAALMVALTTWGRDGGDLLDLAKHAMSIVAAGARLQDL
jgi:AcrR family transcriptional regulator